MNVPLVAVTGATGFLGRHLVAALTREGARIRVLTRRDAPFEQVDTVPGTLADPDALARLVAGADAVIHAAGLIKARFPADFLTVNRDGTRAIALAGRRTGARLIVISSLAAREPRLSPYAESKRRGEAAARAVYEDVSGLLTIVRPPVIYGAPDQETLALFKIAALPLIPVFGTGRLALIHVNDAAAAIARLATGAATPGFYALADLNPAGYTMPDILAEAARVLDRRPRFIRLPGPILLAAGMASERWSALHDGTPIFTTGKAREALHPDWSVSPGELLPPEVYRPATGIAEGFRATAAWYKAAGWLS